MAGEVSDPSQHREWEVVQGVYAGLGLFRQSVATMRQMYDLMGAHQIARGSRLHKGMPLVWIADNFNRMGMPWHSFRFTLLAFIEDVIEDGAWNPGKGAWHRLVYSFGVTKGEIESMTKDILAFCDKYKELAPWPELVLAGTHSAWPLRHPAGAEGPEYIPATKSIEFLRKFIGKDVELGLASGDVLNWIAAGLCSALPGARCILLNKQTNTFEFDVVISLDGRVDDFRGRWGRYLICECKDWDNPAGVSTVAALAARLDSALASAALLFSTNGISGSKEAKFGEREVLKFLQRTGKTIIVVSLRDIESIISGVSFLDQLRAAHDRLFLDITT